MDNLSSHKNKDICELIEARGAELLFLPTYSPDLNPIEQVFSKLKAHFRRIGARTIKALHDAIADILDPHSPEECRSYLNTAGYGAE